MSENKKYDIIKSATLLFNDRGFFNVSIKEIADSIKISPGNLTYHFNKKEDILYAIQHEILVAGNNLILPTGAYITLAHFEELFTKYYEVQRAYRFYFTEMQYLVMEYPHVIREYSETTSQRFKDARKLVDYYIHSERLKTENEHINHDHLIHSLWMTATFWSLSAPLISASDYEMRKFDTPVEALWCLLIPHLTEKGRKEYNEIKMFKKITVK